LKESAKYFAALLQVETHVERLNVGQVFEKVEVALESGVFGILEAAKLLDEEVEDGLTGRENTDGKHVR
jgi:hypothetical protein